MPSPWLGLRTVRVSLLVTKYVNIALCGNIAVGFEMLRLTEVTY